MSANQAIWKGAQPSAQAIDEFVEANWDQFVSDLDKLISIPSTENKAAAAENAPFGPGPREALTCALDMATQAGADAHDLQGYIGYADFPGKTDTQIGIIGHVDVVPAGDGWDFPPFAITRKDGYLVGRGTTDDKGPILAALYAMRFWKEAQAAGLAEQFPYTVRFLFGANEETGMNDVPYYRERFADPAFLFTPDAEFAVGYGEMGVLHGQIIGGEMPQGALVELSGGMAVNAVPGTASAVVRTAKDLPVAPGIEVSVLEDGEGERCVRVSATGKSAHASTPHLGKSAILMLVTYLLENDVLAPAEADFFRMVQQFVQATDGSGVGIACEDADFGPLTTVGGMLGLKGGRLTQSVDVRFPTTTTSAELTDRFSALAAEVGGTFEIFNIMEPFLMDPQSGPVQALLSAYNDATGENMKPHTMGGATYAREFTCGVSFGPGKAWVTRPDWVGAMHGPNEAASEEDLKEAIRVYAFTLERLMQLTL